MEPILNVNTILGHRVKYAIELTLKELIVQGDTYI